MTSSSPLIREEPFFALADALGTGRCARGRRPRAHAAHMRLTALATAARAAMVTEASLAAPWTMPYLPSTAT